MCVCVCVCVITPMGETPGLESGCRQTQFEKKPCSSVPYKPPEAREQRHSPTHNYAWPFWGRSRHVHIIILHSICVCMYISIWHEACQHITAHNSINKPTSLLGESSVCMPICRLSASSANCVTQTGNLAGSLLALCSRGDTR